MSAVEVTVFGKPGCVQCDATQAALRKRDIAYVYVDLESNEGARQRWVSQGFLQAPVVEVRIGDQPIVWSGYNPDKIKAFGALEVL